MSERKELIREITARARKSRMINTILSIVITLLVGVSFYTTILALESKHEAQEANRKTEQLNIIVTNERNRAEELVENLRISEENLEGEKAKLELIKIAYDSIRQVQLELLEQANTDELWDYAVELNTVEGYTDYLKLKGDNGRNVVDKIKTLMQKSGYVQIQESSGVMNVEPSPNGEGLWIPKSTRSIRYGVIGKSSNSNRTGDVILKDQPFVILEDSIWSGKTRWAKIAF